MKLTEEQIEQKLDEVKGIKFFLDADPSVLGLSSIVVKLAEIQIQKDRVCSMVTEAMRNVAAHDIEKESIQGEYDRQIELILATDPAVAAQKSAEMRQVHAKMKITDLVLKLHHADVAQIRASWYMKILQNVYSNLESANSNLSRQISVIQLESNINGMGGMSNNNNPNRGVIKNINL